jgi:hypothetical protein
MAKAVRRGKAGKTGSQVGRAGAKNLQSDNFGSDVKRDGGKGRKKLEVRACGFQGVKWLTSMAIGRNYCYKCGEAEENLPETTLSVGDAVTAGLAVSSWACASADMAAAAVNSSSWASATAPGEMMQVNVTGVANHGRQEMALDWAHGCQCFHVSSLLWIGPSISRGLAARLKRERISRLRLRFLQTCSPGLVVQPARTPACHVTHLLLRTRVNFQKVGGHALCNICSYRYSSRRSQGFPLHVQPHCVHVGHELSAVYAENPGSSYPPKTSRVLQSAFVAK